MGMETVIALGRQTLQSALLIGVPLLVVITIVSLLVNVGQVLTSLQDVTISTVPRLAVAAVGAFLLMPWMLRRLVIFTLELFSDFSRFTH